MRKRKSENNLRGKLNLTMHPEVREWADIIAFKRRRSISQLFEDLVEAEWHRQKQPHPVAPYPAGHYHPPSASAPHPLAHLQGPPGQAFPIHYGPAPGR